MGLKRKIKSLFLKFQKTVKEPVYIPVMCGNILNGKTILITGGTGGIGKAIAESCVKNGAKVIIAARNIDKLQGIAQELNAIPYELDISNVNEMKDALIQLMKEQKINVLINCAGIHSGDIFLYTAEKDFDNTIEVNLKGTYFLSQVFSNYLISEGIGGNILNISSVSGMRPAISPYMVSKWGVQGLTQGMAKKLIKYGIVVNAIAPGPVATEMLKLDGSNLNYAGSPAGRYLDPAEIANLAVFMISDMGRMIVGDTVYATGGCGNLTYDDIAY